MMRNRLEKIKKFAEKHMAEQKSPGHNMEHVERVYAMAMKLAQGEKVDLEIIRIAVLLHDIGGPKEIKDKTGKTDHAVESAKMARPFLKKLGYSEKKIQHIYDCIVTHRYRSGRRPASKEAQIIFDADKLETIGAVGIARAFVWVGEKHAHIFRKMDVKKYARENLGGHLKGRIRDKTKHSPQLSWETKEKHILKSLFTKKARQIAKKRMKFSEMFLRKLEREIQGLE